jgi:D-amino-acid dehydrogenase
LRADKEQWLWLLRLLGNLSQKSWHYRAHSLLALAGFSQECFDQQQSLLNMENKSTKGVLHLFSNRNGIKKAEARARFMQNFDIPCTLLQGNEIIKKEPALTKALLTEKIAAAVFYPNDKTGDAKVWTQALAQLAKEKGVTFHFGQQVKAIATKGSRLASVRTDSKEIKGDIFVLALGTGSSAFAKHFGLRLPVYPVRGYSITMDTSGAHAPVMGLVDERRRIVISTLGDKLRLAGLADIGMSDRDRPQRMQLLLHSWRALLPHSAALESAQFWTGERPMTPDSLPIIAKSPILDNFYLNTGHGALGWTLCHGSARLVADMIASRPPAIDTSPFGLERF